MRKFLKTFDDARNDGPYCTGCGEYFSKKRRRAKQLCHSCYASWQRQRAKWKMRNEFVVVTKQKSKLHRIIAKKLYGEFPFCNHCGGRQWGWRLLDRKEENFAHKVIHIHHMDGNHQNNDPSNLIPLCPTCHKIEHLKKDWQEKRKSYPPVDNS